jgi:hypothetical protein
MKSHIYSILPNLKIIHVINLKKKKIKSHSIELNGSSTLQAHKKMRPGILMLARIRYTF